MENNIL